MRKYLCRILIFAISIIVCLATLPAYPPVYALTQFGSVSNMIIGQTSLTDCPSVYNGGSFLKGTSNPYSNVTVINNRLFLSGGNSADIKIFNAIPTTNFAAPDIVIGRVEKCSGYVANYNVRPDSKLWGPSNTFYDGSNFYIVDRMSHRVLIFKNRIPLSTSEIFSPDVVLGQPDMNTITQNTGGLSAASLKEPYDVWSNGTKLLISEYGNNRILIFNSIPSSNFASADVVIGQVNMTTNAAGTTASTLRGPRGIDSDGTRLFVADYDNNRVLIFNSIPTANGDSASLVIGQPDLTSNTSNNGGLSAATLSNPTEVNYYQGKLFIGDRLNNRVLIFNSVPLSNGASADIVIGQPNMTSNTANNGGIGANTLSAPYSGYTDGTRLYIPDYGNHRFLIFNTIPSTNGASADVVIGQPDMVSNGNFAGQSVTATRFNTLISGIFYDGTRFWLSDLNNNRVLAYNELPLQPGVPADIVIGQQNMTSSASGISASNLNAPTVAGDGIHNKLFIADQSNNRILVYNTIPNSSGISADFVIGQSDMVTRTANVDGLSARSLNTPRHVYADPITGKLIVSDTSNNRVLIYNSYPTSNYKEADVVIGQPNMTSNAANNGGIGANTVSSPWAASTDGTRLFIADSGNDRVLIYNTIPISNGVSADIVIGQPDMTTNGRHLDNISGSTLGSPRGIFVDGNRLYVADGYNNRVLVFNSIPTSNGVSPDLVIGQPNMSTITGGANASKLSVPNGLLRIGDGLYVSDYNARVLRFQLGPQNSTANIPQQINSRTVRLSMNSVDAKDMMISENSDFINASWEPYTHLKDFVLSSGDGLKPIYVKFRDFANYEGNTVSITTTLDTTAPSGSIAINSGAKSTAYQVVRLNLNAYDGTVGVTEMMVSSNPSFAGMSWESYKTSRYFTLTSNPSTKFIFVKYRDAVGNESPTYQASIAYEPTTLAIQPTEIPITTTIVPTQIVLPSATPELPAFGRETTLKIVDGLGKELVNTSIQVDGKSYTTNSEGKVTLSGTSSGTHAVTIKINGKEIETSFILGANDLGKEITVAVKDPQLVVNWWLIILILVICIVLVIRTNAWNSKNFSTNN